MTKSEFAVVKAGDKILHKHFGKCRVKEIMYDFRSKELFGTLVEPLTIEGQLLLQYYSGVPLGTPTLEHSIRQFRPLDRPFEEENRLLVQIREKLKKQKKKAKGGRKIK